MWTVPVYTQKPRGKPSKGSRAPKQRPVVPARCADWCCAIESPDECRCISCRNFPGDFNLGFAEDSRCACGDCKACKGPCQRPSPKARVESNDTGGWDYDDDDGSHHEDEIEDFGPEAYYGTGEND